jgi:hypothetical protein
MKQFGASWRSYDLSSKRCTRQQGEPCRQHKQRLRARAGGAADARSEQVVHGGADGRATVEARTAAMMATVARVATAKVSRVARHPSSHPAATSGVWAVQRRVRANGSERRGALPLLLERRRPHRSARCRGADQFLATSDSVNDVTARDGLIVSGCLLAFAAGCGGTSVSAARTREADQRVRLIRAVSGDIQKVERIGNWSGTDDVLTAWLKVTRKDGARYVVCIAVDITGPATEQNLGLIVTTQPESACKGKKPKP